jgi:hypothetical protein
VPADALADPQVEDRHRLTRVDPEQQDGVGELDVDDRGLQLGRREGAGGGGRNRAVPVGRTAGVDVVGAEAVAQDPLQQPAFLVGRLAADQRADPARMLGDPARGVHRPLPGGLAQLIAVAHERPGDPLVDVDRLVGEAALVAQPAVVDLGMALVVAAEHPHHALVADGERHVALGRAQGADAAGVLDVPRPGAEAVGLGGERADWAQLDDVAAERGDVGVAVVRADERVGAALGEDELVVLGHLLGEAHAAVAQDAALAVDRDERREGERLLEVALGLDHPAAAQPPAERDVLQRALAALVAHRAVERVVDEQELDHRVLGGAHPVGLGVDDHAVLDRGRARGLQLGDPLDLDQAHAAGADRVAELGLVAEVRDLDVAELGGVDEHRALHGLHLSAVDGQRDRLLLRAWHGSSAVRRATD